MTDIWDGMLYDFETYTHKRDVNRDDDDLPEDVRTLQPDLELQSTIIGANRRDSRDSRQNQQYDMAGYPTHGFLLDDLLIGNESGTTYIVKTVRTETDWIWDGMQTATTTRDRARE